ncbi:MAG: DUF488 family protein [Thermoplasmata archaeon]|uniref:DUF488 family protein n=1 Tax=Candidatus Sysuiplasma superficiale TaxID=2823368 RepID=A0A8J7YIC4_9ARCH|nr:DUF488 family protein [Candidatus Sysuiplasma superficiale]MBX8643579.1 DUF488 family protein [Candidatus Sysuiplasma superficiale]MCL4346960.1 DUF488 family protein [Candidatus Thermoplasmatota archaeon]
MTIRVKRVYDEPSAEDGERILVDRLWPRGLSREKASITAWMREIAPSDDLRKWYSHRVELWDEFRKRYWKELDSMPEPVGRLIDMSEKGNVTLLFSTKELNANNAVALREYIETKYRRRRPGKR